MWRATLGINDRKVSEDRLELSLSLLELAEHAAKPLRIENAKRRGSVSDPLDVEVGDAAPKRDADLLAQAGLRKKEPHRKTSDKQQGRRRRDGDLSFHSLRHTAVTLLKEAGIPQAVVMELVGHDNEEISQHYTRVSCKV